jgi:hypothetical protein
LITSYLIILGIIAAFSIGVDHAIAETDPIITVQMDGPSIFYLNESNQIIRASVEIQNHTPSDGIYFMKVTHLPTNRVMKDFEIYPKQSGNEMWSVQIAYPFLDSDIKFGDQMLLGEFEIHVRTENGLQTASTEFSIFQNPSEHIKKSEPEPTPEPDTQTQIDPPSLDLSTEPSDQTIQKIPEWVRAIFAWYADNQVSEEELLDAIKYLINEGIIKLE